jgi:hypothetical protein
MSPVAHVRRWQAPLAQTELPGQTKPQRPQLRGSVCVLVQPVPHTTWPVPHEHAPPTQLPPVEHWALHAPQFSSSVVVSTQALVQLAWPGAHNPVQTPLEHTGVAAGQMLPQAPQLRGSLCVAVHAPPLQRIPRFGQAHEPAVQVVPPVQRVPQVPQLELSVCSSAHVAPQAASPAGQVQTPAEQVWPMGH